MTVKINPSSAFPHLNIRVADTWGKRLIGLLGKKTLQSNQALWIKPCNAIHTFGMSLPIAVHFLDQNNQVIRSHGRIKPWRILICLSAKSVIEMKNAEGNDLEIQRKLIARHIAMDKY